jgi:hypothetical protein
VARPLLFVSDMVKPVNIQDLATVTGGVNTNGAVRTVKKPRASSDNGLIWDGDHVIVSRLPSFVP